MFSNFGAGEGHKANFVLVTESVAFQQPQMKIIDRGNGILIIESQMGENGVIFSDGIEQDFLEFNSGTRAVIGIAERKGVLVE